MISCNTHEEATQVGDILLNKRLVACYDIFDRVSTRYFWPPQTGKIESIKGCILIGPTLHAKLDDILITVKENHSDTTPYIGYVEMNSLNSDYTEWLHKEIKK